MNLAETSSWLGWTSSTSRKPSLQRGLDDVKRVSEAIDSADLVTVVGRDRDFLNALARDDELDDDFCVEMKDIRIAIEWERLNGGDSVDTVATMELGKLRSKQLVLH